MGLLWTVIGVLVSVLVSVGVSVLGYAPPEFKLARACFWASAILLGFTDVVWHLQTDWSLIGQLCVALPVWTGTLVGLPIGLRWIKRREAVYVSSFPKPATSGFRLFDGSGKEVGNEFVTEPTQKGKVGFAVIVIITMILSVFIAFRFYESHLTVIPLPDRIWPMPPPPSFGYDHTPVPKPPPLAHLQNPIDVITFSSLESLTVRNQGRADLYIVDTQISQKQTPNSVYFKLGFDLPSGHIKDFPLKDNAGLQLHSLGVKVGTTWNDIVQEAARQYGMPCVAFVYFSVNASGLATMENYYKAHGAALAEGDATGMIHYRSPNSSQDKTQNLPLVVTLMRNKTPPCPI
jgi:hypothetical protein